MIATPVFPGILEVIPQVRICADNGGCRVMGIPTATKKSLKWRRAKSEPQMPRMAQIPQIKSWKSLIGVISVISVICGSDSFYHQKNRLAVE